MFTHILTDGIVSQIRESAALERIPYSHIAVDAIGVGAGVASSPLMAGIIGFKSSFSALRTTLDPTKLPNVHFTKHAPLTSEYANLRSQCVFALAEQVNDHKLSIRNEDPRIKSAIIEELAAYQDVSKGDGKRMATMKEDVKAAIGRSPDISDTLIMRMYFHLRSNLSTSQSFDKADSRGKMQSQFRQNEELYELNSNK